MTEFDHIPPPPNARQLLAEFGLRPKKSWGQNFLCDPKILRFISQSCEVKSNEVLLELGAGLGALTYYLVQDYSNVIALERDRDLLPILKKYFSWAPNLDWLEADAGSVDYGGVAELTGGDLVVVGNLPYQISSRILVSVSEAISCVRRAIVMVQREVAERVVAKPGGKAYGVLSVLVQRSFEAEVLSEVPPDVFLPPPKVHSAIVALERKEPKRCEQLDLLVKKTAKAAFSTRRKTLRNSLAGGLGVSPVLVQAVIEEVGFDSKRRAETLSLEEFDMLAQALNSAGLLVR